MRWRGCRSSLFLVVFLESYVWRYFSEALPAEVEAVPVDVRVRSSAPPAFSQECAARSFFRGIVLLEFFILGGSWFKLLQYFGVAAGGHGYCTLVLKVSSMKRMASCLLILWRCVRLVLFLALLFIL